MYDTHGDIDAPFPGVSMCVIPMTAALTLALLYCIACDYFLIRLCIFCVLQIDVLPWRWCTKISRQTPTSDTIMNHEEYNCCIMDEWASANSGLHAWERALQIIFNKIHRQICVWSGRSFIQILTGSQYQIFFLKFMCPRRCFKTAMFNIPLKKEKSYLNTCDLILI